MVLRAAALASAAAAAYCFWLRFIASREEALAAIMFNVRCIASLFSYKVRSAGGGEVSLPPKGSPAVLCVYHGFIPLDMYFLQEFLVRTQRDDVLCMVADFVFQIPFFSYIVRLGGGIPANREAAEAHLKAGGLLVVAPGGVREAMTTTAEDNLVRWFGRSGFAEVARRAGAPIFPVFTKRMRDVFLVLGGGLPLVQKLCKSRDPTVYAGGGRWGQL